MTPERDEFEEALTNWSGDAYLAAIASIGGQQAIDAFVEDIKRVRATHRRALAKAILQVAQPELYDAGVEPDENYSATQARDILERDQRVALAKARAETWRKAAKWLHARRNEDRNVTLVIAIPEFMGRAAALDKETDNGT